MCAPDPSEKKRHLRMGHVPKLCNGELKPETQNLDTPTTHHAENTVVSHNISYTTLQLIRDDLGAIEHPY